VIVGRIEDFALESEISVPLEGVSQQGLGFFLVHVAGTQFGVRDPQATLLGCSVGAIEERLAMRGLHRSERLSSLGAGELADAYLSSFYGEADGHTRLRNDFLESNVIWCPDGDAAFDDGSHILQFDQGELVRILAFRNEIDGPADLVDRTISADEYYSILRTWLSEFRGDRDTTLKNARR